jgi:hypothetical protein
MSGSRMPYVGKPGRSIHQVRDRIQFAPPPIAPRDPCWRCGVRADVGCDHSRALAA